MSDALINGLAGAGGGIIAQLITYPLQTVNARQQTDREPKKEKKKLGTLEHMCQVVKHEGWGRLYGGLTPSLVGTAASQGVYYYFYQIFRNKAEAIAVERITRGIGDGSVGMFSSLVVAALAGCANVLLTNPIWVVVTRMQTHTQAERKIMERKREALLKHSSENSEMDASTLQERLAELEFMRPKPYGTLHPAAEVYKEAGIRGFWKGIVPTLIMVCNPSIQFMIYETSMKSLREKRAANNHGKKEITALEVFVLGAVAKLGATVATYPLLVVKSRLQAKQDIGSNVSLRYSGTLDAITKMIQYEGLFGFYKGMSTKIVQSVFAASVLFMVKEELVKAFTVLTEKSRKIRLDTVK
uniref:Uncharacterized protein n=1 Tax=Opuntia streptacantha TaxID=393608 RepID=A0A7C8ZF17_OPUST